MSNVASKYQIDTPENREFLRTNAEGLLRFGHRFPSPGGGSYYLGDDGTPWKERPRETWITSRMCHVYSIGTFLSHPGSEELADAALKGLRGELHDTENGGWYSGRTADDGILPGKACYAHAFVILAASSAVLAERPGAQELLDEALALYDKRFWNEEEGLSCDTWNTEFTELDSYRGLNANMHSVEAFLAASDVTGDEKYRVRAGRIIDHVLGWAGGNNWRIPEHYSSDWVADLDCNKDKPDDQFKPYGATPGHGIEWSRHTRRPRKRHSLILRRLRTCLTARSATDGTRTARPASFTRRDGTESLSFTTACTGRWQRRSTLPHACTM